MRSFLNSILTAITASTLTDPEFTAIDQTGLTVGVYNQAAYDQLAAVLQSRESISDLQDRLVAYFKVQGTDVTAANTGKSNIYLGSVLE